MKTALLIAFLALAAPAGGRPEIRTYAGWLPGAAPEGVAAVQVLDARTGLPIPGARMAQYEEDIDPGSLGAPLLAETRTDAFGFASIRWKKEPCDSHWVFDAPGYAVIEKYGPFPPPLVWLGPGRSVSARLLDPFGQPVAGAEVELFLGCGHSPAVRRARTGPDGRFLLQGVSGAGSLWFVVPGLGARYIDLSSVLAAGDDAVIVADPGFVLTGRVVDAQGKPVPGAVIRSRQTYRGPAAVSGPDGSFRLAGLAFGADLVAYHSHFRNFTTSFFPFDMEIDRGPIRLVLPAGDHAPDGPLDMLGRKGVAVPVRFTDAATGETVDPFPVRLRNLDDGMTYVPEEEYDEDGEPTGKTAVTAPPGAYEILPANPFSERRPRPGRVSVRPGRAEPIVLASEPQPRLSIVAGRLPDEKLSDLDLLVRGGIQSIDLEDDETVRLPAAGPSVLRARADGIVRLFAVGPPEHGIRRVRIDWPEPKTIRVPLPPDVRVDPSGGLLEDRVTLGLFAFRARREGPWLVISTQASGRAVLGIEAADGRRAALPVRVPGTPGAVVRTGPPRFSRPPGDVGPLRLIGPDGAPVARAAARVVRNGRLSHGKTRGDGTYVPRGYSATIDGGGTFDSDTMRRRFAAPPAILEVEGWATRLLVSESPGPLEVRYPPGRVDLHVRARDGTPLDFAVAVDGLVARGKGGHLLLRGVEPGRRTLIVGTPRHGVRLVLLDVPGEGAARLDLELAGQD